MAEQFPFEKPTEEEIQDARSDVREYEAIHEGQPIETIPLEEVKTRLSADTDLRRQKLLDDGGQNA
jgi:hypothetical protein